MVSAIQYGQLPPKKKDPTQALRERQQKRVNGIDFASFTSPQGVIGYQEPLPDVDIRPTWGPKETAPGLWQQGFALTIRSQRGGLEMQRGFVGAAHTRQSQSTMVSHSSDEMILSFAVEQQTNYQTVFSNYNILSCTFQDRLIMAPFLGAGAQEIRIYVETSATDPTVISILLNNTSAPTYIFSIGTARFAGQEILVIMTNQGAFFYSGIAPVVIVASSRYFNTILEPATEPTSWVDVQQNPGGTVTGFGWLPGTPAVTQLVVGMSFVQSGIPGSPLIVRGSGTIILVPTEGTEANTNPYTQDASLILNNVGLSNHQSLGGLAAGGREPAYYWWETNNGGPASQGPFTSRITYVDAYGFNYKVLELSLPRILGCATMKQRGGMAFEDGYHGIFWNGREEDLGLFADEAPVEGYTLFCTGVYEQDGQLYAEINELPNPDSASSYGTGIGEGRIRAQKRRYDFDLKRWFSISDWLTLTENGLIRWNNGVPVPVGDPTDGKYGFMSAYGAPWLPMGRVTRYMHNHVMPPRYSADLTQIMPLPSSGNYVATWTRKFEPPAGVNPYSFRGSDKPYADSGVSRTPGIMFDGDALYANKYLDGIETGMQDTGGPGSGLTVRCAEHGHLDDVDSNGDRTALSHTFNNGLPHAARYREFRNNRTAFMIPQFEFEGFRDDDADGADNTLTPQFLPFTAYFHVDLPDRFEPPAIEASGRSKA